MFYQFVAKQDLSFPLLPRVFSSSLAKGISLVKNTAFIFYQEYSKMQE